MPSLHAAEHRALHPTDTLRTRSARSLHDLRTISPHDLSAISAQYLLDFRTLPACSLHGLCAGLQVPIAADDEGEHKGMPKFFFFAADWKEGAPVLLMCRNLQSCVVGGWRRILTDVAALHVTAYVAAHLCF